MIAKKALKFALTKMSDKKVKQKCQIKKILLQSN